MRPFRITIISPERFLLEEEVESLVLPGYEGEMGIWAHHTPLVVQLEPGSLRFSRGGETKLLALSGGFSVVYPDHHVEVLAETAELAEEIDVERARQALERARTQLLSQERQTAVDVAQAQAALRRALVRLKVAEGIKPRRGTPRGP